MTSRRGSAANADYAAPRLEGFAALPPARGFAILTAGLTPRPASTWLSEVDAHAHPNAAAERATTRSVRS